VHVADTSPSVLRLTAATRSSRRRERSTRSSRVRRLAARCVCTRRRPRKRPLGRAQAADVGQHELGRVADDDVLHLAPRLTSTPTCRPVASSVRGFDEGARELGRAMRSRGDAAAVDALERRGGHWGRGRWCCRGSRLEEEPVRGGLALGRQGDEEVHGHLERRDRAPTGRHADGRRRPRVEDRDEARGIERPGLAHAAPASDTRLGPAGEGARAHALAELEVRRERRQVELRGAVAHVVGQRDERQRERAVHERRRRARPRERGEAGRDRLAAQAAHELGAHRAHVASSAHARGVDGALAGREGRDEARRHARDALPGGGLGLEGPREERGREASVEPSALHPRRVTRGAMPPRAQALDAGDLLEARRVARHSRTIVERSARGKAVRRRRDTLPERAA
jgi:hypothetical protein